MKSALIVVDVQNDFCPGGALEVKEGDKVIDPVNKLIEYFDRVNLPVFYTRDWHPENHCSFIEQGGPWPPHCIANSKGAEFHKDLNVVEGGKIISKAENNAVDSYSGFQETNLDVRLKELNVNTVYVVGLATDYCVKNTVLDSLKLGYKTVVIKEGIKAVNVNTGDGDQALEVMRKKGAEIVNLKVVLDY